MSERRSPAGRRTAPRAAAPRRPRPWTGRGSGGRSALRLLARAGAVVALWALLCAVALLFGGRPDPVLLALALLGALATWVTLRSALTDDDGGAAGWRVPCDEPVRAPGRDPRLDLLERQVDAHLVARAGDVQLLRQLLRLADQRLLDRHGVLRDADPARAATLLGPDLVALAERVEAGPGGAGDPTSDGRRPRLAPATVAALLTRIEAL